MSRTIFSSRPFPFQVLTVVKDLRDQNQFVKKIVAGDLHAVVVTSSGIVWSWGHNSDGQLGLGDTIRRSVPHLIQSLSNVVAVAAAAGARHSLVLTSNGQVWAFGSNQRGQLGVGDLLPRMTPTQVIGALASAYITAITAGQYDPLHTKHRIVCLIYFRYHSVVLSQAGDVYTWGMNYLGQLGLLDTVQRLVPVKVKKSQPGQLFIAFIAAGAFKFTILCSDPCINLFYIFSRKCRL